MTGCSMTAKRMGNDLITGKQKIGDISNSMKTATTSTKALGVAMNVFANVGFMLAITAISKVVYELAQAQENAVQAAKEATEAYNDEISSIDDYKTRLSELHKELNSGNLSYEETKAKRTELMSIQDELIEKFGTEKSAIESVTEAINGQVDALNTLSEKSYRDWVAKADEQTFWNQLLPGGKSGLDQAIDYMETDQTVSFSDMQNANLSEELQAIQKEIDETIKSKYNLDKTFAMFNVTGTPEEIKSQLEAVRQDYLDLSKDAFLENGISSEMWEEYRKEAIDNLNEVINKFDDGLEKHQETYQTYIGGMIKYDSEYSDEYATILQKRAELESAQNSGNKEAIQKARQEFMDAINKGISESGSNENIKKYFESLYPELQSEFSSWNFEIALSANTDGLTNVANGIGKQYTAVDLLDMVNTEGVQEGEESFNILIDKAYEYGVITDKSAQEVQKLIDLLVELGYVKNNVKDETSNEEITVPSFSSAFNAKDFADTKEKLLELAKAGELTPYTLSSTKEYKTLLDQTGLTAEQVYKKIMKVAKKSMDISDWQTTLDNSRKNIIALKEMKNSLSEDGISAVSSDVVSNYPELIGCLESETDLRKGINGLISDYETKAKEAYFNLVQDSESYYSNLKNNESAKLNTASKTINAIVNANKTLVSQLGGAYNVDLKNFKSVAQAKASLEQQLIINSAKAWSKYYKVQLDASKNTAKVVADGNFNSGGTGGSDSIKAYEEQSKAQNAANASAKAYNEAINSLKNITYDTVLPEITNPSGDTDKATKSTTKFSQAIDWCAQTLSKLSKTIDLYSAKLDRNTNSVKTQIKYYKELLNAQNNIVKGYAKTESKYKSTYTKALKKLSKSDQKKVKEGTYTIEQFSGKSKKSGKKSSAEKRYNNIQKALEARDNYLDAQTDSVNAKNQLQEYAEDLASVRWEDVTEKVEKLNNQISVLDTKMSNVSGYKAKNEILKEQLALQKKILTKQQNAYENTQSDANAYYKKISSKYKKNKNDDGTIKTKGVTNQTQLKYIKVYNAYVRQLAEDEVKLAQAQEDYTAALIEATKAQFDNVQAEYDNKTNLNRTKQSRIQSQIDLREAYGEQAGTAYYDAMIRYNNSNKKHLEEEATSLQNELNTAVKNGKIEKYSDEWYEMANAIYEVQNSIDEMDKSTAEYQEALRELADTRFDNLIKQFDRLQSNMEFMGELLDYEELYDDNGNMTDEGIAKLGVLLSNLESKKVESEQIANRRSSLQELLTQAKAEGATSLEFEDATYSIEQAEEKLAELNDTAQDSILDYKSLEKTIADYLKEGMQAQIDAYNELIDKKKEALDADQDLYEFQKKMKESTQDIVQLERQLAALEGDDSDEARKKRRELEQQLKEAKESQSDELRDRAIEMEKENLDKQAEQYEKDMQDKMEHISENLDEFISTVNTNSKNILTVLKAIASQNGYELPEEIEKIFNSEGDAVSNPNSTDTTSNTKTVSNNIVTSESEKNNKAEAEAIAGVEAHRQERDEVIAQEKSLKQTVKEIMEQGTKKKVSDYPKGKKDASFKKLSNLNQYLVKNHSKKLNKTLQVELGKALGISTTTKKVETDAISKKIKNKLKKANIGYAQGGYINTVDLMEVAKTNGDDGWITAKNGEFMLTKVQSDNFLKLAKIAPEFVNATQAMMDNMNLATTTPPYISNTAQPQSIDNSVSIQVNGNPDKDALRQMEKIAQNIVDSNQKQIQRMAYNRGMRIR